MGLLQSLLAEVLLLLGCISFFGIGRPESIEITTKSRELPLTQRISKARG
jgi:hypothetical protein